MKTKLFSAVACGGVAVAATMASSATPLAAQVQGSPGPERSVQSVQVEGDSGWLGISVDLMVVGPQAPEGVTVRDVYDGSPAAEAGIRPGSVILRIGEEQATAPLLVERALALEVGDSIRFRVRTGDEVRDVALEAGSRPEQMLALGDRNVQARIDSLWDGMIQQIDSVRIRVLERRAGAQRRVVEPVGAAPDVVPSIQEPASVPIRLRELQTELIEVQTERANLRGRLESAIRSGDTPREGIEERLRSLDRQARDLEAALREVYMDLSRRNQVEDRGQTRERRSVVTVVPRPPYASGRDFVAGARLSSLNPSLSEYFGGAQGVLVLEVLDRSPAGQAGLVPGDVITRVSGQPFESVEELRSILMGLGTDAADFTVIRRGEELRVQLPR